MFRRLIAVFLFVLAAEGCGENVATIQGEVTLDSQPLSEGLIRFVPLDGEGTPTDGPIKNGKYHVQLSVGEKRVEITAPKVVGKRKLYDTADSPEVDEIDELLRDDFNVESTLRTTVKAGENQASFPVQAK